MSQPILEMRVSSKGIKPVRNGHPWIFKNTLAGSARPARVSAAVERIVNGGDRLHWEHTQPVVVADPSGEPLGWGIYNSRSRLAVRVLSGDLLEPPSRIVLERTIRRALAARSTLFDTADHNTFRLVFGEADGLPGVVADLYGAVVSLQYSGAFAWDNREIIETILERVLAERIGGVRIVRSVDTVMMEREGLASLPPMGGSREDAGGGNDDEELVVRENGLPWRVRPGSGQKTGLYCDQRDNRRRVAELSRGKRVFDGFCYHGGFGLLALHHGASAVTFLDSSTEALALLRENAALQGADPSLMEAVQGDVMQLLRTDSVPGGLASYDLVVLDPPKLVPGRHALQDGLRAYKDLNLQALKQMASGALLATFSCSGVVTMEDLRRTVAWAAADVKRPVRIEGIMGHPLDHPVPLAFPEAEYLKGLLLRVG